MNSPCEHTIEELDLPGGLLSALQKSGVTTVGQLADRLAANEVDEIPGIGPGRTTVLREKVELHELRAHAKKPGGATAAGDQKSKPTLQVVAAAVAGVVSVAFYIAFFVWGNRLTQPQIYFALVGLSLAATVILFAVLWSSAVMSGTIPGTTITFRFAGAASFFFGSSGMLWYWAPKPALQTVQVYLVNASKDDPNGPTNKIDGFTIHYRRPSQGTQAGQTGSAAIQDLPVGYTELKVNAIDCFGFVTAKQAKGETPPWSYPIEDGTVTIEMVRKAPAVDPMPKSGQVREMLKSKGMSDDDIRQPGKFGKQQVALTIENATDRPLAFVAFDCVAALADSPAAAGGKLWTQCKDSRRIQPGEKVTWGTFEKFHAPSGWFALFVRYDDGPSNRVIQRALGIYNLFRSREPRLVIERSDEPGVGFRLDDARSRLED